MKHIKLYEDYLEGGKADNKTLEDIANAYVKKHGGKFDKIMDVLKKNFKMGMKVEVEHTDKNKLAKEITKDHLEENPHYYEILKKAI